MILIRKVYISFWSPFHLLYFLMFFCYLWLLPQRNWNSFCISFYSSKFELLNYFIFCFNSERGFLLCFKTISTAFVSIQSINNYTKFKQNYVMTSILLKFPDQGLGRLLSNANQPRNPQNDHFMNCSTWRMLKQ